MRAQGTFPKSIPNDIHEFYTATFKQLIRRHFFTDVPEPEEDFKALHDFSDAERDEIVQVANQMKQTFKEEFGKVINGLNVSRQDLSLIRRRLKMAESNEEDPVLAADRVRKEQLEREIVRLESDMEATIREIGQLQEQQKNKQKQHTELGKKLTVSKRNKNKNARLVRLINALTKFIAKFQQDKKQSLEVAILDSLNTLMHKKGFIHAVEVDIVDEVIYIHLLNEKGGRIAKEGLSKGEQQMYATALLRGLVEESRIDFPVFIDSPMQKFDEQHAENIIRHFYPTIADQVIIFPLLNKELNRREYNLLSKNVAGAYLIQNVHADQSKFVEVPVDQLFDTYDQLYQA